MIQYDLTIKILSVLTVSYPIHLHIGTV